MYKQIFSALLITFIHCAGYSESFDAVINSAIEEFNVPGIGVGVIKDGEVVLAQGYGTRNLSEKLPVTKKRNSRSDRAQKLLPVCYLAN